MERFRVYAVLAAWLTASATAVEASVVFDDGGRHVVDYVISMPVDVDWDKPGAGTEVRLVDGAELVWLDAYQDCSVTVSGGRINASLKAWENSTIAITGGAIGGPVLVYDDVTLDISGGVMELWMHARDRVEMTISGGRLDGLLEISDDSVATISGGVFGNRIGAIGGGLIMIDGSDFAVDGQPVPVGVSLRNYGTSGIITGTLAGGEPLNCPYIIIAPTSDILLIPEPASLAILGLGGVLLRRNGNLHRSLKGFQR